MPFDFPESRFDGFQSASGDGQLAGATPVADVHVRPALADAAAREYATDPARNVLLEASAGTGKTTVLVERYINLLRSGVDPEHILAVTFTRKAAAEMRGRIIARLRDASRVSQLDLVRWRELRDRLDEIAVSTIDAFCLSLLREFPLEADVDPGFELADETLVPRLIAEALDGALHTCRAIAGREESVRLVFAQLGERRLRAGLAALLERRLVAPDALRRYLERAPRDLTAARLCERGAERLRRVFSAVAGGARAFFDDGPVFEPAFAMLANDIVSLLERPAEWPLHDRAGQAAFRALVDRLRGYFLKQDGAPRGADFSGTGFKAGHCPSGDRWKRHRRIAGQIAPSIAEIVRGFRRDLNALMSRGVWRVYAVAAAAYERTLDAHALLDFPGVLDRAVKLLKEMDEFAESRFRLESRYRHVLVDEFQDTSRAQWELVAELVRTWGEGAGASSDALPPSIFLVGDRKQSIYGFRDADASIGDRAAAFIAALRREGDPRRAISVSFRADPALLAFVNDLFAAIVEEQGPSGAAGQEFRYTEADRFPVDGHVSASRDLPLGLIAGASPPAAADRVADEIRTLLSTASVRDRLTGERRHAVPADIAILFRSRDSHREFERALARRSIMTYVYKGLGFFDADEVQDGVALLKYLADPLSDVRAAAFLRSRIVRLSDPAIAQLSPRLSESLIGPLQPAVLEMLEVEDRHVLMQLRDAVPRWLTWVDHVTPSELLAEILAETAYVYETRGRGRLQARENLKKLAAMVRRFQNRGYATLARVAEHLDELAVGDESNAAIDAADAVSLMTVHAAKGLEFPIVFVVNMWRGTGAVRAPIRVMEEGRSEPEVSIADYQSEADEQVQRRDREETKRLLYVALTRARDRLYLSATVQEGVCRTTRGSLGEVLPASFKALFSLAIDGRADVLSWPGASATHYFRVPETGVTEATE